MRESGVLLHIATLPCKYGIGGLGKSAYGFVDFLARAKQRLWQVLPLVPTGYGDSPYQSCCSTAGNEYFIDLDGLIARGWLTEEEAAASVTALGSRIDYACLFETRTALLRTAFSRFPKRNRAFAAFVKKGEYADYALFRSVKESQDNRAWNEWEQGLRLRDAAALDAFRKSHKQDLLFWQWTQFLFFEQWQALREYAHGKGIRIVGDMPIYVAYDSVECWTRPELFAFDGECRPTAVAGCPPDAFSADGQLWGNPLYRWDRMREDGFSWWKARLEKCFEIYDVVRIDHFRGFDRYWSIPYPSDTAASGHWEDGPSTAMFREIERELGKMDVIAEDLGTLDDSARRMFSEVGYPGMKVLQFAFDSGDGNEYLPHNYTSENCAVYTGTHDNDTLMGNIRKLGDRRIAFRDAVRRELRASNLHGEPETDEELCDAVIDLAMFSRAARAVVPMQDWLKIGEEGRINLPSTLGTENWSYRLPSDFASDALAERMGSLTECAGRTST